MDDFEPSAFSHSHLQVERDYLLSKVLSLLKKLRENGTVFTNDCFSESSNLQPNGEFIRAEEVPNLHTNIEEKEKGKDFRQNISSSLQSVDSQNEEIKNLQIELTQLRADLISRGNELHVAKTKIVKYNNLVKSKAKELENTNAALQSGREVVLKLSSDVEEAKRAVDRLENEKKAVESAQENVITSLRRKVEELESSLRVAEASLESSQSAIQQLEGDKETMKKRIDKLAAASKVIQKEKSVLASQLSELSQNMEEKEKYYMQNISSSSQTIDSQKEEIKNLQIELTELRADLISRDEELQAAKTKILKYNTLVKSKAKELENTNAELQSEREVVLKLSSDVEEAKRAVDTLENEKKAVESTQESLVASLRSKVEELESSLRVAEASLESSQTALQQLEGDKETMKKKLEKLAAASKMIQKEKSVLASQVSEQGEKIENLTAENNQLRTSVSELEGKSAAIESSVGAEKEVAERKVDKLTQLVKAMRKEKLALEARLEDMEVQLQTLVGEKEQLQETAVSLEQQLADVTQYGLKQSAKSPQNGAAGSSGKAEENGDGEDEGGGGGVSSKELKSLQLRVKRLNERNKSLTQRLQEAEKAAEDRDRDRDGADRQQTSVMEQDRAAWSKEKEKLQKQLSELQSKLELQAGQLRDAVARGQALSERLEEATRSQDAGKATFSAQLDSANEKIQRMKSLLARSRSAAQAKDQELAKLKQLGGSPFSNFNVLVRVAVRHPDSVTESEREGGGFGLVSGDIMSGSGWRTWCLVTGRGGDESATPARSGSAEGQGDEVVSREDESASVGKWVPEEVLEKWVASGSQRVGAVPKLLQEMWSEQCARDLQAVESRWETERAKWVKDCSDAQQQFAAYKARAQMALKRAGADDHEERIRLQLEENKRLVELQETIIELEQRLRETTEELETLKKNATEAVSVQVELESLHKRNERLVSEISELEVSVTRLRQELEVMSLARDEEAEKRVEAERNVDTIQAELEALKQSSVSTGAGASLSTWAPLQRDAEGGGYASNGGVSGGPAPPSTFMTPVISRVKGDGFTPLFATPLQSSGEGQSLPVTTSDSGGLGGDIPRSGSNRTLLDLQVRIFGGGR